ncbi:TPA: glucosyltransferase domain-containing protein [Enterobacter hormaechei]|uniref:glucosyltransferase domain-containing protein n=1 Tax=Enterobacter hormaechei TaxID=158836 RepID=UPI001F16DE44|nr:glucosyltransferase domain-containing protein [Enterobacter hormaechei]
MNLLIKSLSKERAFYFSLSIISVFLMPMILANVYYRDDLDRVLTGMPGWSALGRPVSDWLMNFASLNSFRVLDIYPLPLIIAGVVVSLSITYCVAKSSLNLNAVNIIIFSFIFVSPFLLQNISYKYDSLAMAVGVSLSSVAFFYKSNNRFKDILTPSILIATATASYQPTSNIFIGLVAANLICSFYNGRDKSIGVIEHASQYILGLVIYSSIVYLVVGMKSGRDEIAPLGEIFPYMANTLSLSLTALMSAITKETKAIFLILIASLGIRYIYSIAKTINIDSKKDLKYFLSIFFVSISPVILVISLVGPTLVLKSGFAGFRTMQGASALIIAMLLSFKWLIIDRLKPLSILMVIPILLPLSMSYILGNSIKNQKEYEERILSMAFYDISTSGIIKNQEIFLNGTFAVSPRAVRSVQKYPIIASLLSPSEPWQSRRILSSFGLKNVDSSWGETDIKTINEITEYPSVEIIKNRFYTIYIAKNKVLVDVLKR